MWLGLRAQQISLLSLLFLRPIRQPFIPLGRGALRALCSQHRRPTQVRPLIHLAAAWPRPTAIDLPVPESLWSFFCTSPSGCSLFSLPHGIVSFHELTSLQAAGWSGLIESIRRSQEEQSHRGKRQLPSELHVRLPVPADFSPVGHVSITGQQAGM